MAENKAKCIYSQCYCKTEMSSVVEGGCPEWLLRKKSESMKIVPRISPLNKLTSEPDLGSIIEITTVK